MNCTLNVKFVIKPCLSYTNDMKIHETYIIKEFILFSPKTSKHFDKKFPKYF